MALSRIAAAQLASSSSGGAFSLSSLCVGEGEEGEEVQAPSASPSSGKRMRDGMSPKGELARDSQSGAPLQSTGPNGAVCLSPCESDRSTHSRNTFIPQIVIILDNAWGREVH